jgi:hypothetical protein
LLIALLVPCSYAKSWPGLLAALGIGVLGGVAITIRPTNVLFFLPPFVMLIARYAPFRGQLWLRGAAMLVGAVPFVLPLLWCNLQTFGTFTRTGYSYWCASIYDVPGRSFRFGLATLRKGVRLYYLPFGLELDPFGISGLPFLALVAVSGQIIIGFVRAWRGALPLRHYALFALTTLAAFQLLYLPYTFRYYWFAYPAYVCLIPFLAGGLGCLWPGPDSGQKADTWRVVGLIRMALGVS